MPFQFSEIQSLKGVGSVTKKLLNDSGIFTTRDLLLYRPLRIEHLPLKSVKEANRAEKVAIKVRLSRKNDINIVCEDPEGSTITVIASKWTKSLPIGSEWVIDGRIKETKDGHTMMHPNWTQWNNQWAEYHPLYRAVKGVARGKLRSLIMQSVFLLRESGVKDQVSDAICKLHDFDGSVSFDVLIKALGKSEARVYKKVLSEARVGTAQKIYTDFDPDKFLQGKVDYRLTPEQSQVLKDIFVDLNSEVPMSRLLQGEVGSGKTIVALVAAEYVVRCGFQVAIMVPSVLVANQHYENAISVLSVPVFLMTGKTKPSERKSILEYKQPCVIIGTQAMIYSEMAENVKLVVMDEQHRFGVDERLKLRRQGTHALSMTATPIPRSLYLTFLGYLQSSSLPNRVPKEITTVVRCESSVEHVYGLVKEELEKGSFVYWVAPRIHRDEKSELGSVEVRSALLEEKFPGLVGTIHGKLKDKEEVLGQFRSGKKPILVATTVIEVGIDIHDACMIVIENAERYGVAQLHQLRGRVGRGIKQGTCIFLHTTGAPSIDRLNLVHKYQEGKILAEEDQKARGFGDLLGKMQSGNMPFRFLSTIDEVDSEEPSQFERILWDRSSDRIRSV